MDFKKCGQCQTVKKVSQITKLSEFSKDRGTKSGYQYYCKICESYNQKKRLATKEVQIARREYYNKDRKEEIRDRNKKYYQKNKDKAITWT